MDNNSDEGIAKMDKLLQDTVELVRQERASDNLCKNVNEMLDVWNLYKNRLYALETLKIREEIKDGGSLGTVVKVKKWEKKIG